MWGGNNIDLRKEKERKKEREKRVSPGIECACTRGCKVTRPTFKTALSETNATRENDLELDSVNVKSSVS